MKVANGAFAQSAEMGALPALSALTEQRWYGGAYVGPDRWLKPAVIRRRRGFRGMRATWGWPRGCGRYRKN